MLMEKLFVKMTTNLHFIQSVINNKTKTYVAQIIFIEINVYNL